MTDDHKIEMSFSAEDYRREYLEMKHTLPSEANRVLKEVEREFLGEYEKSVRSNPGLNKGDIKYGVGGSLGVAGVGVMLGTFVFGPLAPAIVVPFFLGGGAATFAGALVFCSGFDPFSGDAIDYAAEKVKILAKKCFLEDLEKGDLLKKFIDGRKRYNEFEPGESLPDAFSVFEDRKMAARYAPTIEAKASPVAAMLHLNGPFNDKAEKPREEKQDFYFPPPQPPFPGGV